MQDVTDLPFLRLMAQYGGADLYCTEYFRVHADSHLEKWILRSITETLPEGVTLSLRELPQAVEHPHNVDPDSVLWWNSPVGKWSRRASVPVVVEGLE